MIIAIIILSLVLIFLLSGIYCNRNLKTVLYNLSFKSLPKSFDGFRIAQISDLHNCEHGKGNSKTLTLLKNAHPDIIVITGDMIDSRRTKIDVSEAFAKKAVKIAPCYYVCGNHEARMPDEYAILLKKLKKAGVHTMQNEIITIKKNSDSITLIGAEDPYVIRRETEEPNSEILNKTLKELLKQNHSDFTVLLCHRPEHIKVYAEHNIDLCLTGHTHGGQIKLPFIGGLFAPNQGFLPKYDSGFFKEKDTTLFISRGVGNSQFPVRFLNPPEIPIFVLNAE
ncbi:MAG: metallophosphoesterase [Ruminococcaceae bacterium]|nr:metallophosphoesterase [Oscillospiraceae bacterium]